MKCSRRITYTGLSYDNDEDGERGYYATRRASEMEMTQQLPNNK